MEKHNEQTKRLLSLVEENPTLRVFPMVHYEVVAGDDYAYWGGIFESVSVDEVYTNDERIWFRSEDEESMIDDVFENIETTDIPDDDDAKARAAEIVKNYEWEKVIVLRIGI